MEENKKETGINFVNLTLKNYKKIRTPFAFFDETGSINDKANRYFCLGMIKCMQPYFLDTEIRKIREKHRFYDEIKWNTLSKIKIKVVEEVIKVFFETPGINFSCIVINKDDWNFEKEFGNDPYKAYQEFTEILLKRNIGEDEVIMILADFVTTPEKVKFEVAVKHNINKELDRLAVGGIHRVDSKGVNIIQIVDLMIGAVIYNYKLESKLVTGDKNKIKILKTILKQFSKTSFVGGVNTKRFKVFEYKNH